MSARRLTAAEAAVLDAHMPAGLTEEMRDVAWCLFEALALQDARCGQEQPSAAWHAVLHALARAALAQLQHLAQQKGGKAIYLAKGMAVYLSARDLALCAEFKGHNHAQLARRYGLTEMRVRQIIAAWQEQQWRSRQAQLPGLGDPAAPGPG